MQWTDQQQVEFLTRFYNEIIAAAADRLKQQHVEILTTEADPNELSYFSQREQSSMKPEELELDLEDIDWVKNALTQITDGPEAEVLADVYGRIIDLAARFEEIDDAEDVSPYIYVMF
ncbi:MAG: hypothetical protein LR120_06245 [Dehalococcoidia bacterium]|nr:hypothetical protein [Dehalococcoidia bacterium]